MKTQTDPKVDYAFKHVFGREESKPAVKSLLNAILQCSDGTAIINLELLNPFNEKAFESDYHHIFDLRERRRQTLFTDQMELHILELSKFGKELGELTTALDRWLYFLRHGDELDAESVPGTLDVPEIRWALGDLFMISRTDPDRELYEARLRERRDKAAARQAALAAEEAGGRPRKLRGRPRKLRLSADFRRDERRGASIRGD